MAMVRSKAVCVSLLEAEEARRQLQKQGMLRHDLRLAKEEQRIFFPVKTSLAEFPLGRIVEHSFSLRQEKAQSYHDIAAIPTELKSLLPASYDVVGTIALIKIPPDLEAFAPTIGDAMLQANPHLRTVCQIEPVRGELRVRGCRVIAGEQNTVTTTLEYGVRLMVDVGSIYYSPRLSSERRRVAALVQDGEQVVDLFAGVAPFSIMIAKYASPRVVYAIDKNETAVVYARRNIAANHVADRVEAILGDARHAPRLVPGKADRVIMNLPFLAHEFFATALSIAADRCLIHYYDILREDEVEARWRELVATAAAVGFSVEKAPVRRIKSYSAREFYIGMDITATRHAAVA